MSPKVSAGSVQRLLWHHSGFFEPLYLNNQPGRTLTKSPSLAVLVPWQALPLTPLARATLSKSPSLAVLVSWQALPLTPSPPHPTRSCHAAAAALVIPAPQPTSPQISVYLFNRSQSNDALGPPRFRLGHGALSDLSLPTPSAHRRFASINQRYPDRDPLKPQVSPCAFCACAPAGLLF